MCLPRVQFVTDGSTSPATVGTSGSMELYVGGAWALYSPADDTTASVACNELGYGSGTVAPASPGSNSVSLPCTAVITCGFGATTVETCPLSNPGCASAFNTVTCNPSSVTPSPTPANNGTIRLVGGPVATASHPAGRVEIFYIINGVGSWGTVSAEKADVQ